VESVSDDNKPDFCNLAAAALDKAGIDPANCIQAAPDLAPKIVHHSDAGAPAIIDDNDDEILYKITFDLPNAVLFPDDKPQRQWACLTYRTLPMILRIFPPHGITHCNLGGVQWGTNPSMTTMHPGQLSCSWERGKPTGVLSKQVGLQE
jgi:hypothetical protein